jgi:hypothetical protein
MTITETKKTKGTYRVISIPVGLQENNPSYTNLTYTTSKGVIVSEYLPRGIFSSFTSNGVIQIGIPGGVGNITSTTFRGISLTSAATQIEFNFKDYMKWNQVGAPGSSVPTNTPSLAWATSKNFVLVGKDSNDSLRSYYSTDGITWTATDMNGAASGAVEASIWYAGDKYYNLRTASRYSSNGINYTNMVSKGVNGTTAAIAFNAGTYVMVNTGTGVATSGDGINWTTRGTALAGAPSGARAAASLSSATYPILFGGGSGLNGTSNGITWTSIPLPNGQQVYQIISDGSQYITAGGQSTCATSPNGSTWTIRTTYPTGSIGSGWTAIAFGNSSSGIKYMLGGLSSNGINVSTDSITWTTRLVWTTSNNQFDNIIHGGPGAGAWLLHGQGNGVNQGFLYWSTTTYAQTSQEQTIHLFLPESTSVIS